MTTIFNSEEKPHSVGYAKPNPRGRLVNLTPHPVVLYVHCNRDGVSGLHPGKTWPLCESPPRVSMKEVPINDGVPFIDHWVRFCRVVLGAIEGLPEPEENTLFIVSRVVAEAGKSLGRADLVVPHDLVRDDEGNVAGCRRFAFV